MSEEQSSLFEMGAPPGDPSMVSQGKVRHDHPETSEQSAQQIKPVSGTLRHKVLEYIRSCNAMGATDEEIQRGLRMNPSTQRPRRIELKEQGYIVNSGWKRKTSTGRNAVVWLAVDE